MVFVVTVYFLALSVLFFFGMHGIVLLVLYRKYANEYIHTPHFTDIPADSLPIVTIQLPMYNEPHVAERLIRAVCAIDYPPDKVEIQILDDSIDETREIAKAETERQFLRGVSIAYIHRTHRHGFKAGALREGLAVARGEYIAIFDADFIPQKDFLRRTIPHFMEAAHIGMVQTRWTHLNESHSALTRTQAMSLDNHFAVEQLVRNRAGLCMNFNGTAGLWRRSCIEDSGNWHTDTLAEDMDLSYRTQMRGWKFVYLPEVVSPAELPTSMEALKSQQFRWTKGAIQTARKLLPKVLCSALPWKAKFEAFVHLTSNIVFPFILLVGILNVPMLFIKNASEEFSSIFAVMSVFVLAMITTFAVFAYSQRALHSNWRERLRIFPLFMAGSMGLAVSNSRAVFEALLGISSPFIRTPKYAEHADISTTAMMTARTISVKKSVTDIITTSMELLLSVYFLIGIGISVYFMELVAIPFQLLFCVGFGAVGWLSAKEQWQGRKRRQPKKLVYVSQNSC